MKPIQLFVPTYRVEECLKEIRECLEIGWTGLGFKTGQFETAWKNYTGLPCAHFLNSNTVGLHLALALFKQEFQWQDGDEIISTPLTFVSTNHAILYEKLKPVFADIDETLGLDPKSVEQRISPKTKAVIFVGIGGNPGYLSEIKEICARHQIKLILDAAHMSGTHYQGGHAGQGLDCSVFSFQAVKNLPTADSGMICFLDSSLDKKVRMWSWLGINKDTYARFGNTEKANYKWLYEVESVGLKAHGNSIMAAIGLVQLKYLEADNEYRRHLCSLYEQFLSTISPVCLIPSPPDSLSSRHLFQIRVPEAVRDPLIFYLNEKGIFPGVHYRVNTDYPMYAYAQGTCKEADRASKELISLPLHLRLSEPDIALICETIATFFKNRDTR